MCLRRSILDLGWQWLRAVSEKIPRKKNKKRKRKGRKGKGKGRQDEDFSDQETKEQEKEREKEKVILLKMKVIGIKMNGKDMRMRIGMKAIGPMKVQLPDYDEYGYFQGKGKKGKAKGKKGHGPQDQGKGQGDGNGEAIMWTLTSFSTFFAAGSSTFVIECLRFLCDTFTCVLDISQEDREWRAEDGAWFFRLCIALHEPRR